MSIPRVVSVNKKVRVRASVGNVERLTVSLYPIQWAIAIGVVLTIGVAIAAGAILPRWQGYVVQQAAEDLDAHERAVSDAALDSREAAAEVVRERAAYMEWLKDNPGAGAVEWTHEYIPTEKDLAAMADFGGARCEQDIGVAYSGTLVVQNVANGFAGNPALASPVSAVSASACGASVSIVDIPSGPPIVEAYTDEPKVPADPPNAEWRGFYYIYRVTVTAPGMGGETDTFDIAVWLSDGIGMEVNELPIGIPILYDPGFSVTWAISLSNAYRRAKLTESPASGFAYITDGRQRTGVGAWFADASTEVAVSATVNGTGLSASGNYGEAGETDISSALGLSMSISLNYLPDADTSYAAITANAGSDEAELDFSHLTFCKSVSVPAWTHYETLPGDATFYTVTSGSAVTLMRTSTGSGATAVSWGGTGIARRVDLELRLWKQNKAESGADPLPAGCYEYTTYDTSEGEPFDVGLYKQDGETDADVSLAPGSYSYQEFWWNGGDGGGTVPDRLWRKFVLMGAGIQVKLRKDWMEANNEDVVFTLPSDNKEYPRDEVDDYGNVTHYDLVDIPQALTFHPRDGELLDPPWRNDWLSWVRTERNLDIPPGANERPSQFTGVGAVTVLGDVWTIPAAGGIVSRTLASRRPHRIDRMNAHLWTGSGDQQEVKHEWLLMTRANLDFAITEDDAKWWDPEATPWAGEEVGVLYEDITDWRGLSCVKMQFASLPAAAPQLRLSYRTLSGTNNYYTSAGWNFGTEEGTFEAEWSATQTAIIDGRIEGSVVKWDLAPDEGESPLDLELVETVEIIFPEGAAEQELTFEQWRTMAYAGDGSDRQRMRVAHKLSDYWGAEVSVDGMPDYKPTYLYPLDTERVEVGYKRIQDRQHDPDYLGEPQDLRYIKSLSMWYQEQVYAETLCEPTYGTAEIAAALTDADEGTIGTPVWGDYDEDEFCLHVGLNQDVTFGGRTVYCDVILQGGARGIAKDDGVREIGAVVELLQSMDGGATFTSLGTAETDSQGMYRIGAGKEKAPRVYYVRTAGNAPALLGGFVNAEEAYLAVPVKLPLWDPFIASDRFGQVWLAAESSGIVYVLRRDQKGIWQQAGQPFGAEGGHWRPSLALLPCGHIIAAATYADSMVLARSEDHGTTWEDISMAGQIGEGLQNGTIWCNIFGHVCACGWDDSDNKVKFHLSTAADLTRDTLTAPPSAEVDTLDVCEAIPGEQDPPIRSSVCQQPDGASLVAVGVDGTVQLYRVRDFSEALADGEFELVV